MLTPIVFLIGVKLIDHRGLAAIRRAAPREFILALIRAGTVVLFGVERGILLAVLLSLLMHVRRNYRPHAGVIVRDDADRWRIEDPAPGKLADPGMLMFWFGASLFYANVSFFAEQVRQLVDQQPVRLRWLVIDASAITELDYSAGCALAELQQDLLKIGVILALIVAPERHQGVLVRMGMVDLIAEEHIFESRHDCIQAYRSARAVQ